MLFLIAGWGWRGGVTDKRPGNRLPGGMEEEGSGNDALGAGLVGQLFPKA